MVKIFANSGDPGQRPHSEASDLGLHCLPITFLWGWGLQTKMGLFILSAIACNLIIHPNWVRAACDYASLNTDLNTCVATASGVSTTKWAFPVGSIADQATICT